MNPRPGAGDAGQCLGPPQQVAGRGTNGAVAPAGTRERRLVGHHVADGRRAQLARVHLGEEPPHDVEDLGHRFAQRPGGVGIDLRGADPRALDERVELGELAADPPDRVGLQLVVPYAPRRLPAAEPAVVMGAVVTPRCAVDRREQVGAPDRPFHDDGLRRVDRPAQLGPLDDADLEPHAALGALLPRARIGRRRRASPTPPPPRSSRAYDTRMPARRAVVPDAAYRAPRLR